MIKKEQCVSVTELKKNANEYMKNMKEPKIIFVNNKPKAVLIEFDQYQKIVVEDQFSFSFNPPVSPSQLLSEYEKEYGQKVS